MSADTIIFNVAGQRFQLHKTLLNQHPTTTLSDPLLINQYFDTENQEELEI